MHTNEARSTSGLKHIDLNGEIFPGDGPVIGIDNRAFRYGDGLFDTIRVINGKPCFLPYHIERLRDGMEILRLDIPDYFNIDQFENRIEELLVRNEITDGGRLRVTMYRDADGFYAPTTNKAGIVIEAVPLENNLYVLNEKGLNIDIYEDQKKTLNQLSTVKSINCLPYVLAGIHKREKELDECIILNELGNIAEAISSNIFIVYNGVYYTPSLNQGCVGGVMRKVIIEVARENGSEVQECPLGPNALLRADEVFITNAVHGIQWIGAYKMKRYFNNGSKKLIENLNQRVANLKLVKR